jgi:glyoxylase-like metal-dependent hydrolase (beta-lactamase superfamily II)
MQMSDLYSGNVRVGGPADTREINGITLTKIAVGPMDNNAYLLRSAATGEQVLIDAANEPDTLLSLIGGNLAAVITTHQHGDHWQALAPVVEATGATTYAGRADADGIPVPTDQLVDDGDTIRIGDIELTAIQLAGHTPGSIALLLQLAGQGPHLFTGDCLFPGGVGNTQKDPERFASLIRDVSTKLFGRLPDQTWVYPGHGGDTTLGAERPHLAEWEARGW